MALQPAALPFALPVQLQVYTRRRSLGALTAGAAAGEHQRDAGLFVQHFHGIAAVLRGDSELPLAVQKNGAILLLLPAALVALNAAVLGVVIPVQPEAAVLVQGGVALQPAALPFPLSVQLQVYTRRRSFFRCQGTGGRSRFGGCRHAAGGGLLRRRLGRAAQNKHECHQHRNHRDPDQNAGTMPALQFAAAQCHKHQSRQNQPVHQGQNYQPVGGIISCHRDCGAVCLRIQNVVAGPTHCLLHGVGAAVQRDAHQTEHHIAACGQGQIHVHPAGVAHGRVGNHHALKAPFLTQHLGKKGMAGACPYAAQIVVAAHNGGGVALLHRQFKGLKIQLAHGLLVCPYRDGQPVAFLIVQGKMLHIAIHALTGAAFDHSCGQLTGKQAVLGVVFKVTAAEGGAVDIGARSVQSHHMIGCRLGGKHLTELLHQLGIPAGADQHLTGERHALQIAGQTV